MAGGGEGVRRLRRVAAAGIGWLIGGVIRLAYGGWLKC